MVQDKSLAFQTWEYFAILPRPVGDVRLRILRYKPGGPRLVLVKAMKQLLGLSNDIFMQHLGTDVSIYKQTDEAIRGRLADLGIEADSKGELLMMKMSSVIKMVKDVGAWEVILKMLRMAALSEPPVSANELGSQLLERATQPWQPLPLTPYMGRRALEEDAEDTNDQPDDSVELLAIKRRDRGPAFVSTRMGRSVCDIYIIVWDCLL